MKKVKATVIIPTTIDRGMLLPYSIGSVQKQTIQDFEIFIIGDGVYNETREIIYNLQSKDDRIKFFDHPKHERRGEVYRHMALQEAKGEIVCYLCDRDLMLPNHIETHLRVLEENDFSSTLGIRITPNGQPILHLFFSYFGLYSESIKDINQNIGGLSIVAHSLTFYRDMEIEWTSTPNGIYTDTYMWKKFMDHVNCRSFSINEATILYFPRNSHPGWPSIKRLPELAHWFKYLESNIELDKIKDQAVMQMTLDYSKLYNNSIAQKPQRQPASRVKKMIYFLKLALYQMVMIIKRQ